MDSDMCRKCGWIPPVDGDHLCSEGLCWDCDSAPLVDQGARAQRQVAMLRESIGDYIDLMRSGRYELGSRDFVIVLNDILRTVESVK